MRELKTLGLSLLVAVLALMLAGPHGVLAANATATANTTTVNATAANATAVANVNATGVTAVANVTQLPNATEVYVVTPSGTIHLVYISNGTQIVINYNKKVITANIKTVIYNATTAYYIHVVGHAIGAFNSTYVSQILSQLATALKSGNTTAALSLLKQLGNYVATSNATKRAEVNIMVMAKSLNATKPNATYFRAKIEYEIERKLAAVNGTSNELEVEAFVRNMSQLTSFLALVSKELQPYDPAAAAELAKTAAYLANLTATVKEFEIKLANGTSIEIHKTGHGYKIEVQVGGNHEGHGDHHKAKETDHGEQNKGVGAGGKSANNDHGKNKVGHDDHEEGKATSAPSGGSSSGSSEQEED